MHFKDECMILSCDNIKVGTLAVSRYHQITKFFPNDDQPNYPDHDFPNSGCKLIPSGYKILTDFREEDSNHESDHCETFDASEYDFCDSDKQDYDKTSSTPILTSESTSIAQSASESTSVPQSSPQSPESTSIPQSSEPTSTVQSGSFVTFSIHWYC